MNTRDDSNLLDPDEPEVGLSDTSIEIENGIFYCDFTRDRKYDIDGYYDMSSEFMFNFVVAYGSGNQICLIM